MRYDFPFLFAAILVLLPEILTMARSDSLSPVATTTATALVCLAVGVWVGGESAFQIAQRIQSVGTALKMARAGTPLNADLRSPALEARYTDMQQHVPAGETLVCHLEKPYLLNFNRNPVYIVDWAGGQSPPPGMPFFKGSEALADYLTAQGLRYLAYSYANQAAFTRQEYGDRLGPDAHPWIRSESKCTFDFQDNIDELRKSRSIAVRRRRYLRDRFGPAEVNLQFRRLQRHATSTSAPKLISARPAGSGMVYSSNARSLEKFWIPSGPSSGAM